MGIWAQMVTQMAAKVINKDAYTTDETICWMRATIVRYTLSGCMSRRTITSRLPLLFIELVVLRRFDYSMRWARGYGDDEQTLHTDWQWRCTMHAMHKYLLFIMTQRVSRNGHVSPMKNGTTIDRHIVKWNEFVLPSRHCCSLLQIIGFSW